MNELLKMAILCYNTNSSVNFAPIRINTGVGGVFYGEKEEFWEISRFPPIIALRAR